MREAWLVVVLLAATLAGCSAPDPASDAAQAAAASGGGVEPAENGGSSSASSAAPVFLARAPAATAAPTLAAEATLSQRWLKPFSMVETTPRVPEGARIAWFVEHEEVEPRSTIVGGEVYVLKSTTPDRSRPEGTRTRADIDGLAPDGRARVLRIEEPGRYVLAAEGARLTVNVWPDAPRDAGAQAFLFEGLQGDVRFEPAEIDLARGGRLTLWNEASRALDVREAGFAAYVPLPREGGRITPIDEGLYHLVLIARDDLGARGVAREPFLVDFERPSERLSAGPATGRFTAAEAGGDVEPAQSLAFGAQHPLRSLTIRFSASSPVPVPASVSVTLRHEGVEVATASTLTTGEIVLGEMPAGSYRVVVAPEHGAAVSFEVSASGVYVLPTPERLRDAMT
jgi:hypothetical protein